MDEAAIYNNIIVVLKELDVLPDMEKCIPEYAYNLMIAAKPLEIWEGKKPKDAARKLAAISANAEKIKDMIDHEKRWEKLVRLRQSVLDLPAEEKLYMGGALENLAHAIDGDMAGLDRFIKDCKTAKHFKPVRAGRKNDPITAYITKEATKIYIDLTGLPVTVNAYGKDSKTEKDSQFVKFLKKIFDVFGTNTATGVLFRAREMAHKRK